MCMTRTHRRIGREPPIHFLKAWRKFRCLTQQQLGERAGVDHSTISRLETGEMDLTRDTAAKLAAALLITVPELFRDSTEPDDARKLAERIQTLSGNQKKMLEQIVDTLLTSDVTKQNGAGS